MKKSNFKSGLIVLTLLAVNLVLVGYVKLESRIFAQKAFLSKHGDKFVIAYKDRDENVEMYSFEKLSQALEYLNVNLRVHVVPSLASLDYPIEYVWVRKDVGKTVLYWKFSGNEELNRITFHNEADAEFFANAIRSGAYSPSPLGHSISLMPVKPDAQSTAFFGKFSETIQAGLSY